MKNIYLSDNDDSKVSLILLMNNLDFLDTSRVFQDGKEAENKHDEAVPDNFFDTLTSQITFSDISDK